MNQIRTPLELESGICKIKNLSEAKIGTEQMKGSELLFDEITSMQVSMYRTLSKTGATYTKLTINNKAIINNKKLICLVPCGKSELFSILPKRIKMEELSPKDIPLYCFELGSIVKKF